jgi:hypothetical protein
LEEGKEARVQRRCCRLLKGKRRTRGWSGWRRGVDGESHCPIW